MTQHQITCGKEFSPYRHDEPTGFRWGGGGHTEWFHQVELAKVFRVLYQFDRTCRMFSIETWFEARLAQIERYKIEQRSIDAKDKIVVDKRAFLVAVPKGEKEFFYYTHAFFDALDDAERKLNIAHHEGPAKDD